jgi:N-acetylglutamate synthase-like GNAT family acetyltransferase
MLIKKYENFNKNKKEVQDIFKIYWKDQEFLEELSQALDSEYCKFYIASENDEVIGVVGTRNINNFLKEYTATDNPIELYIIAVKYKSKGIGNVLCSHILQESKKINIKEVVCYSPETHSDSWRFYEKLGFVQCGIANDPDDGYPGMIWKRNL